VASPLTHYLAGRVSRLPYLRRLPMLRLLALGEVLVLAKTHLDRLEPQERRRLVVLLREGRGRSARLTARERAELEELIARAAPREFFGEAAQKLSPVPLPQRVLRGRRS
jgi:hypothetical protein